MAQTKTQHITWSFAHWLSDVGVLTKWRLTTFVVFSSVMAYAIAANAEVTAVPMLVLAVGGFLVAGAANAMNQILERDFDKLMERTMHRPVASNRMSISEAVVISGVMLLTGIIALAIFNPLAAFLGMLSYILYAFIYTPLKRYTTAAVAVGAVPGAMPVLIGCVAFEGTVTWLAILLFAIQFIWQFPHFWAIGWLSFDQYRAAGFRLLPERNNEIDATLGLNSLIYSAFLVPVSVGLVVFGVTGTAVSVLILAVSLWFMWKSYVFYRDFNKESARGLMFSSFAYLPVVLIIILVGGLLG